MPRMIGISDDRAFRMLRMYWCGVFLYQVVGSRYSFLQFGPCKGGNISSFSLVYFKVYKGEIVKCGNSSEKLFFLAMSRISLRMTGDAISSKKSLRLVVMSFKLLDIFQVWLCQELGWGWLVMSEMSFKLLDCQEFAWGWRQKWVLKLEIGFNTLDYHIVSNINWYY